MARTLIDICQDMESLDKILAEAEGDITDPLVAQTIDLWFEELDGQLDTKVERYCKLIRELELRSQARMAEADRIRNLAKTDANGAKGLKHRLHCVMVRRNLGRIKTDTFNVSICANGGKLPIAINGEVPADYQRTEVFPDTDKIRKDLEDGVALEFARYEERGRHIRVR
jgi:hypothetical protein